MPVAVEILSIDVEKKRIGVAILPEDSARASGTTAARDAEELSEYTRREEAGSSEGFGSLADKLRGALKPQDD
jgi:RNase H-fold protein (predicted Holliday junction resolvase)